MFDRLPRVQGDPASMPKSVTDLYKLPVMNSGNSKATLALLRMVPDGPEHPTTEHLRTIRRYIETLEVPVEIVWGMNDPVLAESVHGVQATFPDAAFTATQAGHLLQEEVPEQIAHAIQRVAKQYGSLKSE